MASVPVQEYSTPLVIPVDPGHTLANLPARRAATSPDHIALTRQVGENWQPVTSASFAAQVTAIAKGFIAAGLEPGDRVAILGRTSFDWTLLDFGAWAAGLVPVPIYETSSADQMQWILSDSGAKGLVLENAKHAAAITSIREQVPALEHVWSLDEGAIGHLVAGGEAVPDELVEQRTAGVGRESLATLIYTSGTTGRPKGCALTHGNFLGPAEQVIAAMPQVLHEGASTLLFLPLAHVFARFVEVLAIASGSTLSHTADVANITTHLGAVRPTFVLAVPRVFEKIYNKAEAAAMAGGKGKIFTAAAETAVAYSTAVQSGKVPLALRAKHRVFDRLVYAKLRALMGGRVEYAVSGGAPLGARLGHFFRGVGVTILEGYGLTETTAPSTVNLPTKITIGTVGPPLPGVTIKIGPDGEILIRGLNVFRDYNNNPAATAEAIDAEGWFHTGDLGSLDADGYLSITGRKKEILITAGGKNVVPGLLEDQLRAHPLISQALVVGDQQPFIAALITLDAEMLPEWSKNAGLGELSVEAARTNPAVLAELQKATDQANTTVSKAESIRKFAVLDTDFTEEGGQLTPSLKLKRHVVITQFADDVAALYS